MRMRVSVNAVIVAEEKLLVVKFHDENGPHYNLPGGGVDPGESLHQALMRECREEASVEVDVGELLGAWEYVPALQNYKYGSTQKLGMIFTAKIRPGSVPRMPLNPDPNQVGVEWIPVAALADLPASKYPPIFPEIGARLLAAIRGESRAFFVRDE
jgi:8-oxo-dGTP diphosphatase